jgi:hypothetical protein
LGEAATRAENYVFKIGIHDGYLLVVNMNGYIYLVYRLC